MKGRKQNLGPHQASASMRSFRSSSRARSFLAQHEFSSVLITAGLIQRSHSWALDWALNLCSPGSSTHSGLSGAVGREKHVTGLYPFTLDQNCTTAPTQATTVPTKRFWTCCLVGHDPILRKGIVSTALDLTLHVWR